MKKWKVFTKRQAEEDTNKIWFYIAQDNPQAAEAFLDAVEQTSIILSTTPEIGSLRYFYPEYARAPAAGAGRLLPVRYFAEISGFARLRPIKEMYLRIFLLHFLRHIRLPIISFKALIPSFRTDLGGTRCTP